MAPLSDYIDFDKVIAVNNSGGLKPTSSRQFNPKDEGYLTEDSSKGGSGIGVSTSIIYAYRQSSIKQTHTQRGHTPGPLSSARARRPRRRRSVNHDLVRVSAVKPSTSSSAVMNTHTSRNKMRTPTLSRSKAFSADRSSQSSGQQYSATILAQSPGAAFLLWPKHGESVLSKCGSTVVAQVMPDKYANERGNKCSIRTMLI
ncbi:borealin-like [Eurosta solidaginis]|uniref:borealin-like n=1 Tax=Eurosta solidaginis TaxID=178769 RepID=UPI00353060AC